MCSGKFPARPRTRPAGEMPVPMSPTTAPIKVCTSCNPQTISALLYFTVTLPLAGSTERTALGPVQTGASSVLGGGWVSN
eukprot:4042839-Pyramimonas_sp.AAC.1